MSNDVKLEPFKREDRYIVIKRKHLSKAKEEVLRAHLFDDGIDTVECVVVESDWPEYEAVWRMIENRVAGRSAYPDQSSACRQSRDREAILDQALRQIVSDCDCTINQYERSGAGYTSPAGTEYEHTSFVQGKMQELREVAHAALTTPAPAAQPER